MAGITLDELNYACHSIAIKDSDGDELAINANGSLNVEATDFDIRDLTHVSDSVKIGDGTDFLEIDSNGAACVKLQDGDGDVLAISAAGELTVIATDFDIRDLTHVSDSVKVGDGTDFLAVNSDGSINVRSDICNTSWQHKAVSVTSTAAQIDATPLADRESFVLQNLGSEAIYIGSTAGVTTANGLKVPACSSMTFKWSDGLSLYGVTASGTADVRFAECK